MEHSTFIAISILLFFLCLIIIVREWEKKLNNVSGIIMICLIIFNILAFIFLPKMSYQSVGKTYSIIPTENEYYTTIGGKQTSCYVNFINDDGDIEHIDIDNNDIRIPLTETETKPYIEVYEQWFLFVKDTTYRVHISLSP